MSVMRCLGLLSGPTIGGGRSFSSTFGDFGSTFAVIQDLNDSY